MIEQIAEGIVAALKGTGRLPRTIVDAVHGIADRAGIFLAPGVVIEGHNAEQGEGFSIGIACCGCANVGRTVVEVVSNPLAIDELKTNRVLFNFIVSTKV